ncbi:pilus assembly protein TadG-related protein [Vibrio makurazakiensis]|uniref:TadE/TadG family type IV pilus assembly protein n=1 Tax=Vibrio makurazakiensis TaxID=2910250 RepID=UPI003D1018EB
MRLSLAKQSGHAAILFAICIPVLFGVFMLGSDGARALQTKARLEEAAEAAVLAVSAEDSSNHPLAQSYIDHYLYDMDSLLDIQVDKLSCDEIAECAEQAEQGGARYFEYRVAGKSQHQSWFPGQGVIVGFGDTFDVTGSSKARRYQSQPVDITFIVDFSGSMNNKWSGGKNTKLEDLKEIIAEVTEELDKFNQLNPVRPHRVAMTGYNRRTINTNKNGKLILRDQRITKYDPDGWDKDDVFYPQKTIDAQFKVKGEAQRIPNEDDLAKFYDIFYTSDFSYFMDKVNGFEAHGGTAFLQGVIRAGQIVTTMAENSRQLIIVLSDGKDSDLYEEQVPKLIKRGMCSNILNMLNGGKVTADNTDDAISVVDGVSQGMKTPSGEQMNARMAVIGFDYELDENVNLKNCVGKDNVYKAENKDEILNQILSLITEEVGHLAQ